ncbi:hypothetical protein HMI54_003683 [Coelomomyces lativittatus]|nr:hypothetical protein HMI56_001815 [Coelomomyces lativittatus]KAJ1507935.1 hypothetical protein HMI54_003683 [Coelomomyces lativittatus]KAJ1512813.1 hypothetical protein HMI55_006094 [Coelomomyces lativittatus]
MLYFLRRFSTHPTTPPMKILGVIGAGQMGSGIAYVGARTAGLTVKLMDTSVSTLEKSKDYMKWLLEKEVSKKGMQEKDVQPILNRIVTTQQLNDMHDADFIIEAVPENATLKAQLFKDLSNIVRPTTILASNTSSISITRLSASVSHGPERVIGMHFMNPVPLIPFVELISSLQTSKATLHQTEHLSTLMGKSKVYSKDQPGFLANRMLMPYINEAIFLLAEQIGSKEDIDRTMKFLNMPMGPLTLADLIGLDTVLAILEVLEHGFGEKFKPCPLLRQYVDAGWLGKKVGKGFYDYS